MSNRVNKYLFDIRIAIESINEFVANVDLERYKTSKLVRSAVERQLEIIGESLKRIERMGESVPVTNAKHIVAFRNILVHEYERLEDETVWMIVKKDVPKLLEEINGLLENAP